YRAPLALPSFPTRRSSDLRGSLTRSAEVQIFPVRNLQLSPGRSARANGRIYLGLFLWCLSLSRNRIRMARKIPPTAANIKNTIRSEEHTSELQSRENLVCR